MSIKRFLGQAGAVIQIDKIALGGTYAAGEQVSVQIGHSTLAIILGASQTTPAIVATVINNAINARTVDENLQGAETRLNAGQLLGEFRDVNAVIDPTSTSNVLIRSNLAGVPFGTPNSGGPINAMVVATNSVSGTIARSSIQAATGPWNWDNAANWDSGTVPANGDTVQFKGINIHCKYGQPNAGLEVIFDQYMSHTGDIGLAEINTDNSSAPYYEYRQRFVRLAHTSLADAPHRFGVGKDGTGSQLINIKHTGGKCSPVVYNTGTPKVTGTKALNLCCTDNTSTLAIAGGSVDYSSQDGGTSAFSDLHQTGGDSRGINAFDSGATIQISGGAALIGGSAGIGVIFVNAGSLRLENQTGTISGLTISDSGNVDYSSTATISALEINGGTFDARNSIAQFTLDVTSVYKGGKFYDPYHKRIIGTSLSLFFDPSPDLLFGASFNEISIS